MLTNMKYILILLAIAYTSGCATYPGTYLPLPASTGSSHYQSQLNVQMFRANQAYYTSQMKKK
jgi:hypothetical protein